METRRRTLLTGATGYVGGRLRRVLEERDVPLRCLVRAPERLEGRVAATTELVRGDVLEPADLERAMQDLADLSTESFSFLSHQRCRHFFAAIAPTLNS